MLMLTFGALIWLQPMRRTEPQWPNALVCVCQRVPLTFSLPSNKCCTFCSSLTDCTSGINRVEQEKKHSLHSDGEQRRFNLPQFLNLCFTKKRKHEFCSPSTSIFAPSAHVQPSRWQLIKAPACTAQPACQACQSSERRDNDLTITGLIGIRRTCSPPHCRLNKHRGRQDATFSPRVSLAHLTGCNSSRGVL